MAHLEYLAAHRRDTIIYTDGSKGPNYASGAMTIYQQQQHTQNPTQQMFHFHPETSSFEAETMALYNAVKYAISLGGPTSVFTDSESALRAIKNPDNTEPMIACIRTTILDPSAEVTLAWVPAHAGIPGNEAADTLAKEAGGIEESQTTPPFSTFIRRYCRKEQTRQRLQQWRRNTTFLAQHWDSIKPPEYAKHLSREQAAKVLRVRMGHTRLTHAFLFNRTPRPGCVACQETLTIRHILTNCRITRTLCNNQIPPLKSLLDPKNPDILIHILKQSNIYAYI